MLPLSVQIERAIAFRQLHRGPGVLALPNAWDVVSARIFEETGFSAIATTSAGIAFSLGYPTAAYLARRDDRPHWAHRARRQGSSHGRR